MSTKILNPDGMPTAPQAEQAATSSDFHVGTKFNLQTGRGLLEIRMGDSLELQQSIVYGLERLHELLPRTGVGAINAGEPVHGAAFHDCPNDYCGGLRSLIKAATSPLWMHPVEGRILGVRLITEAERAVTDAIAMRVLMEIGQLPPTQAAQVWHQMSRGTRQDHTLAYERDQAKARAEAKMGESDGDSQTH